MTDRTELEKPVKIVLLGDPFVGKSSLIQCYALDEFSALYQPTSHDSYKCGDITRAGSSETFSAVLTDVSAREDYVKMRETIYKSVDVFIFCFSLSNIEMQIKTEKSSVKKKGSSSFISLGNIKTLWLPEVDKALGKEPTKDTESSQDDRKKELKLPIKILVGTKSD